MDEYPVVVWNDNKSKRECEYATRRGAQDVNNILGYNKMNFEGDQEPGLRVLMSSVKALSGDQCTLDDSPVGDSQSNGDVESAVKQVEGQFRTMRSNLETCYKRVIPANHNVMPFLVRHSGGTINRENIGADGMTPYKRLKGKEFEKEILKIGECVWFLKPQTRGRTKPNPAG